MERSTRLWLHGIGAAFIGGAAGAAESALILPAFDPVKFNFGPELKNLILASSIFAVLSGVKLTVAYLKQNPVPEDTAIEQTLRVNKDAQGNTTATATAKPVPASEVKAVALPPLDPNVLSSPQAARDEIDRLRKIVAGQSISTGV